MGTLAGARILILTAFLALAGAPIAVGTPASGGPPEGSSPRSDDPADVPEVRARLARLLETGGSIEAARVEVSCLDESRFRRVELFGSGIGIWDRAGQFPVSQGEFRRILGFIQESDFATRPPATESSEFSEPDFALKILCSVSLDIADASHTEQQLNKEKRKEELYRLADRILDECEGLASTALRPASFEEALDLLAAGRLAPQTFSLVLHRKPLVGRSKEGDTGLLLRLNGPELRVQQFHPGTGYSEATGRRLDASEVHQLAERLRSMHIDSFPANLYADEYMDLSFHLLRWQKKVQAQRFSGMTRSTNGPRQVQFDELVEALSKLARETDSGN